jgi:hypothetical protein
LVSVSNFDGRARLVNENKIRENENLNSILPSGHDDFG